MNWQSVLTGIGGTVLTTLGNAAGGPLVGAALGKAGEFLAQQLGVDPTPEAVAAEVARSEPARIEQAVQAIKDDPEKMATLKVIMEEETKQLQSRVADVQDARKSQLAFQDRGSMIAWAPVIVSAMIFAIWGGLLYAIMARPLPFSDAQWQIVNIAFGTASGLAVQVANYWLGSSNGSKNKDATISAVMKRMGG